MSSTTPVVKTQIFLNSPKDWDEWITLLEFAALNDDVWQYINPATPKDELPALIEPVRPTPKIVRDLELDGPYDTPLDTPTQSQNQTLASLGIEGLITKSMLTTKEKDIFEEMLEIYTYSYKAFLIKDKAYKLIRTRIQESVRREFILAYCKDKSPYEMLVALKNRLAQTDQHKEHELLARWNKLRENKPGQDIEAWLQKWETTYDDCLAIGLPDVTKKRAIYAFVAAVHPIAPGFSDMWKVKLLGSYGDDNPQQAFRETISDFREWRRLAQYENKSRGSHSAFPATLAGRTADAENSKPNEGEGRPTRSTKVWVCVCGEIHKFQDCAYLILSKRPTGWKAKKEIVDDIKDKLSRTNWSTRKITIERLQKQDRERTSQNQFTRDSQQDDAMPECAMAHIVSKSAYSVSGESYDSQQQFPLIDSVILDSGATVHVFNDRTRFQDNFREADSSEVCVAGSHIVPIKGWGSVNIRVMRTTLDTVLEVEVEEEKIVRLDNVAYIPSFHLNVASLRMFMKKDIHWDTETAQLKFKGRNWANTPEIENQWVLEYNQPKPRQSRTTEISTFPAHSHTKSLPEKAAPAKVWHRMLGHPYRTALEKLPKMVTGCTLTDMELDFVCEGCELKHATQVISRRPRLRASAPYETIHLDLIQMKTGLGDETQVLHALCDLVRHHLVYTLPGKHQDTLVRTIQDIIAYVSTQWNCVVKAFYIDGEKGLGSKFTNWTSEKGIAIYQTPPYTKEPNGNIERSGRTLIARARALKADSKLPNDLWPEIFKAAGYILNRTPTKSLDWETPYGALHRYTQSPLPLKPDLAHLRSYGCKAFVLIKNQAKLDRLQARSEIGYLVGYDASNIYRVWIPSQSRVVRTRDVTFDESKFWDSYEPPTQKQVVIEIPELPQIIEDQFDNIYEDDYIKDSIPNQTSQGQAGNGSSPIEKGKDVDSYEPNDQLPTPGITPVPEEPQPQESRTTQVREIGLNLDERNIMEGPRKRKPRQQSYALNLQENSNYAHTFLSAFAAGVMHNKQRVHRTKLPPPPKHYGEMLKHPHRAGFQAALEKEYNDLVRKETFDIVEQSEAFGEQVIPTMEVFTYKFDEEGYLLRYKARIVVRGDLEPKSTLEDNYAATLAAKVFRALMAIAAYFDLEMIQLDAVNAFCNALLQKPVFVRCPEGFQLPGMILKLKRALYGLRVAPLLWFTHLAASLTKLNLSQIGDSPCVFANQHLIVFFYVDDIAILYHSSKEAEFRQFRTELLSLYEMREIGQLEWFLAVRIVRDRSQRKIWLLQDSYIDKIAKRFDCTEHPFPKTPMDQAELSPYEGTANPQEIHAYQNMVGSINYLAVISRPDIARTAQKLSEFLTNPGPEHRTEAKRAIRYAYNTKFLAISYGYPVMNPIARFSTDAEPRHFNASSDASYGDCPVTRRSTQGYIFFLFGGAIDWQSAKQKTVSTSTTEAELLSLSYASRQLIWWKRFFAKLDLNLDQSFIINCDNLQTVRLMIQETPKLITKLRHVDIHQHWLREQVQEGDISIEWVKTTSMPADGLTKSLSRQNHESFVRQLQLSDVGHLINL